MADEPPRKRRAPSGIISTPEVGPAAAATHGFAMLVLLVCCGGAHVEPLPGVAAARWRAALRRVLDQPAQHALHPRAPAAEAPARCPRRWPTIDVSLRVVLLRAGPGPGLAPGAPRLALLAALSGRPGRPDARWRLAGPAGACYVAAAVQASLLARVPLYVFVVSAFLRGRCAWLFGSHVIFGVDPLQTAKKRKRKRKRTRERMNE